MSPEELARQARLHVASLRLAGVDWLPDGVAHEPPTETPSAAPPPLALPIAAAPSPDSFDGRAAALEALRARVAACTRCPALASTRTQTVFGVGPLDAELCFVGEAPGADEDRLGEPFVGAAGQLLDRIIAACGLKRSEVYICNILRCRPPGNRQPQPDEAANCRGFLEETIALVRPKVLCALGGSATKFLLGTSVGITKLRGQWREYDGLPVMCTFHPSYLLRLSGTGRDTAKRQVWDDMKQILTRLGKPIPGAK